MPYLFFDIETRSAINLELADAWRYASDPTTEVLCVGYAVDGGDPQSAQSRYVSSSRDTAGRRFQSHSSAAA